MMHGQTKINLTIYLGELRVTAPQSEKPLSLAIVEAGALRI